MIKISFIVATYNRADTLKDTLECLLHQETNNEFDYEIIIIDNNSKDHTSKVLASYALEHPRLRCLFEPRQGKSYAMNTGLKAAQGEIIACVDDDCLFERDYLWNINQVFGGQAQEVGVLGGKIGPKWIGDHYPFWLDKILNQPVKCENGDYNWLKISFEGVLAIFDFGNEPFILDYSQKYHLDIQFFGGNMAFRKKTLEQYGGFDIEKIKSQDTEICKRLFKAGVKGVYAPNVKVYHKTPASKGTPAFFYKWWFDRGVYMDLQEDNMKAFYLKVVYLFQKSFQEKDLFKKVSLRWRAFFNLGQMVRLFKQTLKKSLSKPAIKQNIKMNIIKNLKKNHQQLNKRGLVLMYHRINQSDFDPRRLSVSPDHFEEHLQIIKKYGQPLQMQKMGKNLKQFSLGRQEIVVTLDDGYADNFRNAKPLLEKHGVPATFFITSGAIDRYEEFFWDGLERTILEPESLPEVLELTINGQEFHWSLEPEGRCLLLDYSKLREGIAPNGSVLSRAELYNTLVQTLGPLSIDQRNKLIGQIFYWSSQTFTVRPDSLPMTADELVSLARCSLFEIGAHTVNHPSLTSLSLEKQEEEILGSKQDLEDRLTRYITSFSYPHGKYVEGTVDIVKRLKFKSACTVFPHPVMRNTSPYLLPRFAVINWNGDEFERHLQNWLAQ